MKSYMQSVGLVSPQAIDTLKSLEQLQNLSQAKIIKRVAATSPIKQFFLNGRQVTVFGNQPKVIIPILQQGSFANQTDRISSSHARSISNEMQNFKQQVQENNILLQTIISKYESTPKLSIPMNNSGTQTPTMFNRNSIEDISQERPVNQSPQINLIQKKKLVLNQILEIDNQIKLLQDEEVKMKLDPNRQKTQDQNFTPMNIGNSVRESNFMKKLGEWMKKKKDAKTNETEYQTISAQTSILRECTSKGNLTSKNERSMKKRVNVKKVKAQKSLIIKESKSPNKTPIRTNSEFTCWIRGKDSKTKSPKKSSEKSIKIKQLLATKLRF